MPATKLKRAVKTVLVIEDEGDMCLLIDLILNSKEISINHVKTIHAAQEYLKTEQPTLILLDNRLPDGLGLDFISYIKKNYPAVKIIMISGVDAAAQDLALENGADNFLAKPFTKAQLHEKIKDLLN